jgi:GNAT superfamily N-acetyltransferase
LLQKHIALPTDGSLSIREAQAHELHIINRLAHQTWPHAFENILTAAQVQYMLAWMYHPHTLLNQHRQGQRFLICAHHGADRGFAAIEHHWKDSRLSRVHKLYVLPQAQKTGTGSALMQHIEHLARQAGDQGLSLNVNRYNPAVGFYEHLGFVRVASEDIDIGQGYLMEDYVMERRF